jgi:acyl transferase domain-containing protein
MDLLRYYGIKPDVVVGHSSGEIAAAYACGSITAQESILIAYYRGKIMVEGPQKSVPGGMAAVGLGPTEVQPYLTKGVIIGCENSPGSTTLSGDKEILEQVMQKIKGDNPDILVRALRVDLAYHSRKMHLLSPWCLHTLLTRFSRSYARGSATLSRALEGQG